MPKRKKMHLIYNKEKESWQIKEENAKRALRNLPTKKEALEEGRKIAAGQKPSQLIIHKKDGKIQTEHTYGQDPYPPEG